MNNLDYDNKRFGKWGEELAASYLKDKGYQIIKRNFRSPYGEIDIIALDNDMLVFVEVKTRHNSHFGYPEESVTNKKMTHIINTAQTYLSSLSEANIAWRIDILAITRYPDSPIEIHHIVNAT